MIKMFLRFLFGNKKSNENNDERAETFKEVYAKISQETKDIKVVHDDISSKLHLPFIIPKERLLAHNEFLALIKQEKHFSLAEVLPKNKDYYHKLIYYFKKKHSMRIVYEKSSNSYKYQKDEQ